VGQREDRAGPLANISCRGSHPIESDVSKPGTEPKPHAAAGNTEKVIEPVSEGTDNQSIFFHMWRHEHADGHRAPVPADMVMAWGSGMDPHITVKNARFQLDRVAAKWAQTASLDQGRSAAKSKGC
jgi:K+-transporting ATPase ATPase C chain